MFFFPLVRSPTLFKPQRRAWTEAILFFFCDGKVPTEFLPLRVKASIEFLRSPISYNSYTVVTTVVDDGRQPIDKHTMTRYAYAYTTQIAMFVRA